MQNLGAVLMYHHSYTTKKAVKNIWLRDTSQLPCDLHVSGTSGYHTLALCHAIHIRLSLLFIFLPGHRTESGSKISCAQPMRTWPQQPSWSKYVLGNLSSMICSKQGVIVLQLQSSQLLGNWRCTLGIALQASPTETPNAQAQILVILKFKRSI